MSTVFLSAQTRRRFLAFALPLCVSLAVAGLPASMLPRARAQIAERIKAPELDGAAGYLGTDKPIHLKDLRGKIVILDFWTLC